jgi:nucleoside-triphosphatase
VAERFFSMEGRKQRILVTGRPGVGKTTVIKQVIEVLEDRAGGFYTEEIRHQGRRTGFLVRTLNGKTAVLAHVTHGGAFRVGRYGVDVDGFEKVGVVSLERAIATKEIIIIDEIGTMELYSRRFWEVVERAFASDRTVIAVIHQREDAFTRKLRQWPDVEVWTVTRENRDRLASLILEKLGASGSQAPKC